MADKIRISVIKSDGTLEKGSKNNNGFIEGVEENGGIQKIKSDKSINEIISKYLREKKL